MPGEVTVLIIVLGWLLANHEASIPNIGLNQLITKLCNGSF